MQIYDFGVMVTLCTLLTNTNSLERCRAHVKPENTHSRWERDEWGAVRDTDESSSH